VKQTKALAIQDGDAQPVLPTPFTVATEDYPLSRRLFFYTPSTPNDPLTKQFVDFAVSDDGQALIGEAGLVPLSLRAGIVELPTNAPPRYRKLTTGATRLSVNFRFKDKQGVASLDAKARHDLDRLLRHVASPINRGRHVMLAGFSDEKGDEEANDKIAKQGLALVVAQLAKRDIKPEEVASFGSALPLAPNDSPQGRARNRRVEVWLH
jgi:phosphate transport system substrate-binding protein